MSTAGFSRSIAISVGIDQYANGIPKLQTAANDARGLARLLKAKHGYHIMELLDETATRARLQHLLQDWLPKQLSPDDRLLFYFAGHGLAMDGDDGPAGYLVPQDGKPGQETSSIPMRMLHDALTELPCRHALIILDCCFSGAFRWSSTRDIAGHPEVIYQERFDRFIQDPAWQVITSSAYDQTALDVLEDNRGQGRTEKHSPFAEALFDALGGAADRYPAPTPDQPEGDGVITATELYLYLRDRVELATEARKQRQTPGIWPLRNHDKGEYIFLTPGHALNLPPAPALNAANNPYQGLESFDEAQAHLFFGRSELVKDLQTFVEAHPLTVVLGPSGAGKSSLVKAGLLPALQNSAETHWQIVRPFRPGDQPVRALARSLSAMNAGGKTQLGVANSLAAGFTNDPQTLIGQLLAQGKAAAARTLLVIDQFEELITQCRQDEVREQFLDLLETALVLGQGHCHVILTLRSDFEPQFTQSALSDRWMQSRFLMKPMAQNELREAIAAPAAERVMYFEPHSLVDQLINEVVQMPGALPLLSFTLSELYLKYLQRRDGDRALTQTDYEALGGVAGSLTQRATQEYDALVQTDAAYTHTVKQAMLRMVAVAGGELARRRVPRSELVYASKAENARVAEVIRRLTEARLIVEGQEPGGEPYVEPAHDALVQGWHQLQRWKNEEQENLALQRLLTPAAREWQSLKQAHKAHGLLWDKNPRLNLLQETLASEQCWLNRLERDFVEQSLKHRRHQRIKLGTIAASVFLTLSGLTTFAFVQRGIAERNAVTAQENEALAQEQTELAEQRLEESQDAQKREEEERQRAENQATIAELRAQAADARRLIETEEAVSGLILAIDLMQRSQDNSAVEQTAQSIMMRGLEVSREINLLQSHEGGVTKVVFSHDGSLLASGGEDGTLRLWDIKTGQPIGKPLEGHETPIDSIAFTRDNRRLVSGDASNEILIWDIETQQVVAQPLKSYTGEFSTHALSLGGSRIAVVRDNVVDKNIQGFGGRHLDRVQLFDTMTGTQLTEPLDGHPGDIHAIAFSPDGKYFATGVGSMHADTDLGDNTVRVWDAEAGELVDEAMAQDGRISYIAFSSGNQIIVSNLPGDGVYGSLRLWQPLPYQIGWRLGNNHPESFATAAVFSPTRNLVVAVIGKTIQQLDPELALDSPAMQLVDEPFRGHTNLVSSVAISPDGQYIASSSLEGKIRLWAAEYDANSDDSSQASIERLNVACDRLRYHPMLNKPETLTADSEFIEIANRARSSCQKQFWQEE